MQGFKKNNFIEFHSKTANVIFQSRESTEKSPLLFKTLFQKKKKKTISNKCGYFGLFINIFFNSLLINVS